MIILETNHRITVLVFLTRRVIFWVIVGILVKDISVQKIEFDFYRIENLRDIKTKGIFKL